MSKIDEILNFLTNDLNIKISNKKRDLIIYRFYPDIKDKIYWSIRIDERNFDFFYEGIVSKDEYEKIKTLSPDTHILFASPFKYHDEECALSEISFKEDANVNEIKELYDKGFEESKTYFDIMEYLYENEELKL